MSTQPKAAPITSAFVAGLSDYHSSYGYRHELPMLIEYQWRQGLYWRWNTFDVQIGNGEGVMACYLAKLPFWKWMKRILFEKYDPTEWRKETRKSLPEPEPKEFRYPAGLDLSAFWFRLDFDGKNPRDPGFEWAWERDLLPVEEVELKYGHPAGKHLTSFGDKVSLVEAHLDELTRADENRREESEWDEFMASEFVSLNDFLAWKRGEIKNHRERLQDFDDKYERPRCRCGRSHPELKTPLAKDGSRWAYKKSFYMCLDCDRKWTSKPLRAALDGFPIDEKGLRRRKNRDRGRERGESRRAQKRRTELHDVLECAICQSGNTAKCSEYQKAYGDSELAPPAPPMRYERQYR